MFEDVKICGVGEPCAKACPFVRVGKPCIGFDHAVALTTYVVPEDQRRLVA
jgi:hypothetical protein